MNPVNALMPLSALICQPVSRARKALVARKWRVGERWVWIENT